MRLVSRISQALALRFCRYPKEINHEGGHNGVHYSPPNASCARLERHQELADDSQLRRGPALPRREMWGSQRREDELPESEAGC